MVKIETVHQVLPQGSTCNAIDCELWDLAAKISGTRVWRLTNLSESKPISIAYTLSPNTPEAMC
jgi:L-alanine-DL-glutamate epimerase-like enolase superfamily enzyme